MKTKKIILAITCVFMMIAMTQCASASHIVSKQGTLNWQQGALFTITFVHGTTVTTETFHENDMLIMDSDIQNGDSVSVQYINELVTFFTINADGSITENFIWVREWAFVRAIEKQDTNDAKTNTHNTS